MKSRLQVTKRLMASLLIVMASGFASAFCQTLSDSIDWQFEMEDSISGMTMKLVEQPEVLLKKCLWKLYADSKVRHSKRQYRVKKVYGKYSPFPGVSATVITTVESDNGITLKGPHAKIKTGKMHIETPRNLRKEDISHIQFFWRYTTDLAFAYPVPGKIGYRFDDVPDYDYLIEFHDITAYSIKDEKGRGVYRIDLTKKKLDDDRIHALNHDKSFRERFYFDTKSLRLTQYRSDILGADGLFGCCKQDFGEEYGAPILTKSQGISIAGSQIHSRVFITLMDDKESNPENMPTAPK